MPDFVYRGLPGELYVDGRVDGERGVRGPHS